MFTDRVNKIELAKVAEQLAEILKKYQHSNRAAKNVLDRSKDLIDRAKNMQIDSPLPKGFFPEEFWEDGDLFLFDDLTELASNFNLLLRGAESIENIKKSVKDIERQAMKDEADVRNKRKS